MNRTYDTGVKACIEVFTWHTETTGLNMSEQRAQVMRPPQARNGEEIADAIEAWEHDEAEIRRMDPRYEGEATLPDPWKMSAVKGILVGRIKEHIELQAASMKTDEKMR